MPFKFSLRKRIKLFPGVRLNTNFLIPTGLSIGGRKARVTLNKRGARVGGRVGWFSWWFGGKKRKKRR